LDQMFRPPGTEVVVDHYALGDSTKQPRCQMTADKPRATRMNTFRMLAGIWYQRKIALMWHGEYSLPSRGPRKPSRCDELAVLARQGIFCA
jgi:hypothetical protein